MSLSTGSVALCFFQVNWTGREAPRLVAPGALARALMPRLAALGGTLVCEYQPQPSVQVWRRPGFGDPTWSVRVVALVRVQRSTPDTDDAFDGAFPEAVVELGVPASAVRPPPQGPFPFAYLEEPFAGPEALAHAATASAQRGTGSASPDRYQPNFTVSMLARLHATTLRPGQEGFVAASCIVAPRPAPAAPRGQSQAPSPGAIGARATAPAPNAATDRTGGRAFLQGLEGLGTQARDRAIVAAITAGQVPSHLRTWVDLDMSGTDRDGVRHTATLRVRPDYLAVGTDEDWVYVPLLPVNAQRLLDAQGAMLPTRKMVQAIWNQARIKYTPRSRTTRRGVGRDSLTFVLEQNELVQAQRAGRSPAVLAASAKKDIVISTALPRRPGMMAIWGWVKANGRPIQSLFLGHSLNYRDYSHGVRGISRTMRLDGREVDVATVLRDPVLATLLSDEGRFVGNPSY